MLSLRILSSGNVTENCTYVSGYRAAANCICSVTLARRGTRCPAATVTLSAHATLEAIADGVAVSNLDVDFLKATTIVADKIDANEITMNKLKTAPVSGQGSVEIGTAGIRILDSSSVLRVAIGNLSRLATNHNNA